MLTKGGAPIPLSRLRERAGVRARRGALMAVARTSPHPAALRAATFFRKREKGLTPSLR